MMALRPVFARLFSARVPLIFLATAIAVTAMAAMTSVSEQMHPDERREHQHPHPVLR
jgi:hypothetical protein